MGRAGISAAAATGRMIFRRALAGRLETAGRVTVVSAPGGSGKTVLLRSWVGEAGQAGQAAWVAVAREERDPQRFWIAVADALRGTAAGSYLVRPLTAAPDLDGWAIVERLLSDLAGLDERIWLIIDDVHELASAEELHQLELFLMRAPPRLRFVLATRHDVRLGLHRLRLNGELTEIRATDLRFTLEDAQALFDAAGVQLSRSALALLHARTEGWAAGLRLAALSLAGHPDPDRFAEEFSGSERTVADYLLAEVLDRQTGHARQLLLRTSVLERVNGELADLLTGGSGGERMLHDLEQAGAFVVSLDAQRSWFRYHQMFADLLQLELRHSEPAQIPVLHRAAAGWFAGHGYPVEAVRHAQGAQDWDLAARLLADHWVDLDLDGQSATAHELLTTFPAATVAADAELTVLMAAGELTAGSLEEAEHYLTYATRTFDGSDSPTLVPADRHGRWQVLLAIARLQLARRRGDLTAVAAQADRLLAPMEAAEAAPLVTGGGGEDLRALALISLGIAEVYAERLQDADRHLEQGVALARRIGRPYLELTGLAHGAVAAQWRSFTLGEQRSRQAIELAERHGWGEDHAVGIAYAMLGASLVIHGRVDEAGPWFERAGRTLRAEAEPAAGMYLHYGRWALDMAQGRPQEALADYQAAERLAGMLVTPHTAAWVRAHMVHTLVRLGQTERAKAVLAGLDEQERDSPPMRTALAALRLACHEPQAAAVALVPILDGSVPSVPALWRVTALLLEAIARDALGDTGAAGRALEQAFDAAVPDRMLIPFLIHPPPGLLRRHARQASAHATLIGEVLGLLAGTGATAAPPGGAGPAHNGGVVGGGRGSLHEPLSQAETRVLRYLPTGFTVPEIAGQLNLSVNTVRTHMRHVYDKLGAHRRHDVIDRARTLGLLAPSTRKPS